MNISKKVFHGTVVLNGFFTVMMIVVVSFTWNLYPLWQNITSLVVIVYNVFIHAIWWSDVKEAWKNAKFMTHLQYQIHKTTL